MGPRKRDRSKTPEVPWELLPNGNSIGVHAGHSRSRSRDRTANGKNGHARAPAPAPAPDPALLAAQAAEVERDAWRRLVILLAQLKGDRKVEQLLREKHPELLQVADRCGASSKATSTLHAAKDAAREWFSRGLRGSNQHGPAARAKLCKQLMLQLLERASQLCSGVSGSHVEDVLDRGRPTEEGPLVCSLMARELRGSRYEGLWISRKGPAGHYYLGDEQEGHNLPTTDKDGDPIHPRVHAVVKVVSDQLVISGFFLDPDDDTMSPAKVPIGPFLSVYFEGMSVREASNAWKNGPPKWPATPRLAPAPVPAPVPAKQGVHMDPKLQELQAGLPPGWEEMSDRLKITGFHSQDSKPPSFDVLTLGSCSWDESPFLPLYPMFQAVKGLHETGWEMICSLDTASRCDPSWEPMEPEIPKHRVLGTFHWQSTPTSLKKDHSSSLFEQGRQI